MQVRETLQTAKRKTIRAGWMTLGIIALSAIGLPLASVLYGWCASGALGSAVSGFGQYCVQLFMY